MKKIWQGQHNVFGRQIAARFICSRIRLSDFVRVNYSQTFEQWGERLAGDDGVAVAGVVITPTWVRQHHLAHWA
jgi:hypothetical protein